VTEPATNPEQRTFGDAEMNNRDRQPEADRAARDIGEVPAVEVITTVAVHLMSAAAVKCGLGEEGGESALDLDEARKLINALAGLVVTAAPDLSTFHAAPLRDGLKALQLAFREASPYPDPPGHGPGEKLTGPVI
jgi:Domain of unknown function (DUF1844)